MASILRVSLSWLAFCLLTAPVQAGITAARLSPTGTHPVSAAQRITVTATVTSTTGISSVEATLRRDGEFEDSVTLTNGGKGSIYTGSFPAADTALIHSGEPNVYTVQIVAYDDSGNQIGQVNAAGSLTITRDISVTLVSMSPTGEQPAGARPTVSVTATVTTASARGISSVEATLQRDGGFVDSIKLKNGGAGSVYTGAFPASDSGVNYSAAPIVYTVQIVAYDRAGNQAGPTNAPGSLTIGIDTTPPVISEIRLNPKLVPNGSATITVSATVTDSGPKNTGLGSVLGEWYKDGADSGAVNLSKGDDDTYIGVLPVGAGDAQRHNFLVTLTARDNANNTATLSRGASQAGTTVYPAPTLTGLSPDSAFTGSGASVTLNGTNFDPESVVLWNGLVLIPTYVSPTQLTVAVDKTYLMVPRQIFVQAYNHKPAGGRSADQTFTIKPSLVGVSLAPASVLGGTGVMGTVTLEAPAFTDQSVPLTSSDPGTATVPAAVTISGGQTSATFPVSTSPVTAAKPVTLTGALGATLSASLAVNPITVSTLTISPDSSIPGGTNATGTITLNSTAPGNGLVVALASSSPAAQVPASVVVTGGSATATFPIQSAPITDPAPVTLTATLNGVSQTAALTIAPPALSSLTLTPTSVTGGRSARGILTLTGPAVTDGTTIQLTSDNPAAFSVPATAQFDAGLAAISFTAASHKVSASTTVTVTATYNGVSKTATITVTP